YAPPFDPQGSNDSRHFVLRTTFANTAEELKEPYLGTVAEVWDLIQRDLETAKELLPENYVTTEIQPKGRANKYAAAAMLSRVYFITGQHDKALAETDFVIGSSMYNLQDRKSVEKVKRVEPDGRRISTTILYFLSTR